MSAAIDKPQALASGAVYFGDNGRTLCSHPNCAGTSAAWTGLDLSGHPVLRAQIEDAREWIEEGLGALACECGRVALSHVAGADGWPLATTRKETDDA